MCKLQGAPSWKFFLLLLTTNFHTQIISPSCSVNKQESNQTKKTHSVRKDSFLLFPSFQEGHASPTLNRFDLSLLENIFDFHGSLKEIASHCSRSSQSFCEEKPLFISPKALRSRDGGGEFPADVSFLPGEVVNLWAADLSTLRSGFQIYLQILTSWLRTHIQGFFHLMKMEIPRLGVR